MSSEQREQRRGRLSQWMRERGFASGKPLEVPPVPPKPVTPPPPTAEDKRTKRDANGIPVPPTPPEWIQSGILIEFYPNEGIGGGGATGFNFWGMSPELAVANILDAGVRMNGIAERMRALGIMGNPQSLAELDRLHAALIADMQAREQSEREAEADALRVQADAEHARWAAMEAEKGPEGGELRARQLAAVLREDGTDGGSV